MCLSGWGGGNLNRSKPLALGLGEYLDYRRIRELVEVPFGIVDTLGQRSAAEWELLRGR
jgi:hypothetical protein